MENLINKSKIIDITSSNYTELKSNRSPYDLIENNGLMLYKKKQITDYMSIILDGKVEIHAGEHDFFSEVSRWFILCPKILEQTFNSYQNKTEIKTFEVDFSARVITNSRILRISKHDFYNEMNCININDNQKNIEIKIE